MIKTKLPHSHATPPFNNIELPHLNFYTTGTPETLEGVITLNQKTKEYLFSDNRY